MMKARHVLCMSGLFFLMQTAHAGPYEDALQEIEAGQYDQGYALLEPLARAGNAEAQYLIGNMIIDKTVTGAAPKMGVYWLEQAVENQHSDAAQVLSKMYLSGHVVSFDADKGIEYQALANEYRSPDQPVEDCD